jgi:hypothetical protein
MGRANGERECGFPQISRSVESEEGNNSCFELFLLLKE